MENQQAKTKRIVKNTILMYVRMAVTMGVSLYTSRIVLHALGVTDLGIYNLVGGLVTLFVFINSAMLSATQRFVNYELGRGDREALSQVFKTAGAIHLLIALLIVALGIGFGRYLIDHQLQIPPDRVGAATLVLYLSCLTCAFQVITLPFSADIIAHERINVYAWLSIMEYVLRLTVAFMIDCSDGDRLIFYAVLMAVAQLLCTVANVWYCRANFSEVKGRLTVSMAKLREMGRFATWCLIGCTASAFSGQGLNILLGMFFPPFVNAARAIAVQVQAAALTFGNNLNTAMTPQLTQSYASGDREFFNNILYRGSKYVFYLMLLLVIPLLLRTELVTRLWLDEVPQYTVPFIQWLLCATMIETVSVPLMRASDASGRIKIYHFVVGGILLTILPVSYFVLKWTGDPVSVFVVFTIIYMVAWIARLAVLRHTIGLSVGLYVKNVMARVLVVFALSYGVSRMALSFLPDDNFWDLLLCAAVCVAISLTFSFFIGLDSKERKFATRKIKDRMSKSKTVCPDEKCR